MNWSAAWTFLILNHMTMYQSLHPLNFSRHSSVVHPRPLSVVSRTSSARLLEVALAQVQRSRGQPSSPELVPRRDASTSPSSRPPITASTASRARIPSGRYKAPSETTLTQVSHISPTPTPSRHLGEASPSHQAESSLGGRRSLAGETIVDFASAGTSASTAMLIQLDNLDSFNPRERTQIFAAFDMLTRAGLVPTSGSAGNTRPGGHDRYVFVPDTTQQGSWSLRLREGLSDQELEKARSLGDAAAAAAAAVAGGSIGEGERSADATPSSEAVDDRGTSNAAEDATATPSRASVRQREVAVEPDPEEPVAQRVRTKPPTPSFTSLTLPSPTKAASESTHGQSSPQINHDDLPIAQRRAPRHAAAHSTSSGGTLSSGSGSGASRTRSKTSAKSLPAGSNGHRSNRRQSPLETVATTSRAAHATPPPSLTSHATDSSGVPPEHSLLLGVVPPSNLQPASPPSPAAGLPIAHDTTSSAVQSSSPSLSSMPTLSRHPPATISNPGSTTAATISLADRASIASVHNASSRQLTTRRNAAPTSAFHAPAAASSAPPLHSSPAVSSARTRSTAIPTNSSETHRQDVVRRTSPFADLGPTLASVRTANRGRSPWLTRQPEGQPPNIQQRHPARVSTTILPAATAMTTTTATRATPAAPSLSARTGPASRPFLFPIPAINPQIRSTPTSILPPAQPAPARHVRNLSPTSTMSSENDLPLDWAPPPPYTRDTLTRSGVETATATTTFVSPAEVERLTQVHRRRTTRASTAAAAAAAAAAATTPSFEAPIVLQEVGEGIRARVFGPASSTGRRGAGSRSGPRSLLANRLG